MLSETFKNTQQGATSPAQLVHDFERLPHVTRVESDGTRPLRSVFFLQRMWTKSSAPEGGQQSKTEAEDCTSITGTSTTRGWGEKNAPTADFRVLYLPFGNKIFVQEEEQTACAGASDELTSRSAPSNMYSHNLDTLSLSGGACASDCVSAAVRFRRHPF